MTARNRASPNQSELGVITNAFRAALEYSPLTNAPSQHTDLYAYVSTELQRRFWTDIYVDRPEIREIILALETGQLVLITGERGSGKSTAIRAVMQEYSTESTIADPQLPSARPNLLPFVFDATPHTSSMRDRKSAERKVHEVIWQFLRKRVEDSEQWLAFLYTGHPAFEELESNLTKDGLRPTSTEDLLYLAREDDSYAGMATRGMDAFRSSPPEEKIPHALEYIGTHSEDEPLLIIDNVDHLDDTATYCGEALARILQSSEHRVRGAIAVRTENADAIRHEIDNEKRPHKIVLTERPLAPGSFEEPTINLTSSFIEKRLKVLREKETIEKMRAAIDKERGSQLAADYQQDNLETFLDAVMDLLNEMVYGVFRTGEKDEKLKKGNRKIVEAIHCWHNGSLRECGLSLTTFASDVLQDKAHMYQLQKLLRDVSEGPQKGSRSRRRNLRRVTLSLLYRHLLFWDSSESDKTRPHRNVMVFDGDEEISNPPLHFLRLRILQYLAKRHGGRASIAEIRRDIGELDVKRERIDNALRELEVKRTDDDAGLLRIGGLNDHSRSKQLRGEATVQLLEAGKFLVEELYVTTEYLFWSAVTIPDAAITADVPEKITADDIQNDAFRIGVATSFLERFLLEKFRDEHPYLRGYSTEWPPLRARARVRLYEQLFGFSKGNWFLDHAATSVDAFIPKYGQDEEYGQSRRSIAKLSLLARSLDNVVDSVQLDEVGDPA